MEMNVAEIPMILYWNIIHIGVQAQIQTRQNGGLIIGILDLLLELAIQAVYLLAVFVQQIQEFAWGHALVILVMMQCGFTFGINKNQILFIANKSFFDFHLLVVLNNKEMGLLY